MTCLVYNSDGWRAANECSTRRREATPTSNGTICSTLATLCSTKSRHCSIRQATHSRPYALLCVVRRLTIAGVCVLQLANMNSIQSVLMTNTDSTGFYEQEEVRQRESRQKFLQQSFTKLRHSATELKQKATLWYELRPLKSACCQPQLIVSHLFSLSLCVCHV